MKQLLAATTNLGKVREIKALLSQEPIQVLSIKDTQNPAVTHLEVKENGETFLENAKKKAKEFSKASGLHTIADDSGLVVDALEGRPGVHSRRYGDSTAERNQKLLLELTGVPPKKRTARFICAIAIYDPNKEIIYTCQAKTEGIITEKPLGNKGFGYDPIFYSPKLQKTFAQASTKEKNQVSHRGLALRQARQIITQL